MGPPRSRGLRIVFDYVEFTFDVVTRSAMLYVKISSDRLADVSASLLTPITVP